MPKSKKKPTKKALKQKQKQSQQQIVNVNIGRALREAVRRRSRPLAKSVMTPIPSTIFRVNEPAPSFFQPFSTQTSIKIPQPQPTPPEAFTMPDIARQQAARLLKFNQSTRKQPFTNYAPSGSGVESEPALNFGMINTQPTFEGGAGGGLRRSESESGTSIASLKNEQSDARTGYKTDYQSPDESYFSRGVEPIKYPPIFEPNREPSIFRPPPNQLTQPAFPSEQSTIRPSRRRGGLLWNWEGDEKALKDGVPIPNGKYWNRRLGKFMKIPNSK